MTQTKARSLREYAQRLARQLPAPDAARNLRFVESAEPETVARFVSDDGWEVAYIRQYGGAIAVLVLNTTTNRGSYIGHVRPDRVSARLAAILIAAAVEEGDASRLSLS